MLIISHRGNLEGSNAELENNPLHIKKVIDKFDVEIDVWFVDKKWYLGHDKPQYQVSFDFFNDRMWLHCKNLEACSEMNNTSLNWFWHENDKVTLTSKKYIWAHPDVYVRDGITVEFGFNDKLPEFILGVCTDYPEKYNE